MDGAATAAGESTYQSSCAACHGADGAGVLPGVPGLTATNGSLAFADEELVKRTAEGFQSPGHRWRCHRGAANRV
ncbi:c-type cytochrome [Accumulibacter sp.]|uniref:c-type cytochrome n=1 Tax=Accumulibacter sp. TaxID=2053492 RepID=UPI002611E884|nr:c-type cytochrome [Accumulibacter sp.]